MWSHIGLCLLVGFAFASKNSGWKDNTEYVYSIRGRTLTSLHEVSNEYTGILFKAKLVIHPRSDGKLNAKISDAHYAQVHSELENGWNTYIPDSELNYKSMDMSDHPFQIQLEDGVIQDLLVDKSVSNWESNIIKGIVSQFQLNINGASYQGGYSGGNPSGQSGNSEGGNSYVFKTMEETVTGNVETWYDIHPLPEYTLHKRPWISRLLELRGNGDVIEVVKSKNYTNNYELPSYHYGMFGNHDWQPATNQMGTFFVRGSISRAILTGNMNRYTVQNSYTVNEIMISPTMNDKQKGSVVSLLNVTLEDANSQGENIPEVSNPRSLGGLVYTYDKPYSQSNEAGVRKSSQRNYGNGDFNRFQRSFVHRTTGSSEESEGSSIYWHTSKMGRRSPNQGNKYGQGSGSSGEASEYWQLGEFFKQDNPKMQEAPEFPLLPYSTGYQGKSIKNGGKVNMAESVKKIAKDIANDFKNPEEYLRKGSLNKFTIMTSLVRILNFDELQQVASDLYSPPSRKSQYDAWAAFRDAVAEAGTGPAFLIIQDSIQSKKIKGNEAAEIVATMSRAVRVPNPEYMQTYFNFIKKREVQYEEYLNETALMSFSTLVRNVYVDIKKSKNEYPVRSFGNFRTNEGLKMVDHVVGYLTQQLHEAVSRADTQKIHTYIRALGNVGHPKILSAFEPYLEGQKQASQFQRFLMVAAMDHLSEIYPTDAQEVLFKVYQNAGETQEVRMAAVCQLIRTDPPTRMLQRMASYTNIDNQEQVNAAVKSAIESGAELEGYEHQSFRFNAQAAKPLLTKKSYGFQHGYNYLNNYVVKELQFDVTHGVNSIGSNDDYYPKGLKYSTHVNVGGLTKRLGTAHAIVSSIQELIHVGNMQTASYRKQMDEQERNADQQQQEKYSSQKIAHLFNMKADEYEQLEGNFYVELGDYFQKMISFDNHTAEQWVEDIRKYQEELRNGKNCHYTKLTNSREMAISFPTEMGLPFLFTYDTPTLYKVEGDLKGDSSPQVSMNNKLYLPDTAYVKSNLEVTVNYKIQSRLSFLTPFDHQQYIAGFDKNFHVHFPLYGTVEVDFKNGQAKAEIDVQKWHKGELLFHYSSWPYTSRTDIKEFQPISLNKNTHYIKQTNYRNYERVFGKKETGMAMHVKICHERESMSLTWLYRLMQEYGVMGGALTLWDDSSIQHSEISVRHLADKSSVHKCVVHMGFRQKYKSQTEGGTESGTESNSEGFSDFSSSDFSEFPQNSEPLGRQDDLINKLSDGISNAYVQVGDLTVEFQGENNIQHSITGGYGKSNVDPKSRMMFHYKKNSKGQDVKPYEASFQAVSKIPNTNALDLKFSMQREPRADTKFQFKFGTTQQSSSEIHGLMKWRRSESRKQYLQDYPLYQQCQREMRGGDYQLPACANATMTANLLNRANVNIHYKNVKPDIVETVEAIYNAFQVNYYPSLQFKNKGTGKEKEINLQYELDPDLRFANFTVATSNEETTVNNIEVGEWGRTLFAAHPVFHVRSRVMSTIFGLQTYRPICVVDKAHISTFSNRTYPASLDKHWTVALQYIPQDARHYEEPKSVQEQLRTQPENFVVFVRQSGQGRDVKITFSSPETDYKLMDITMGSGQGSSGMKTKVNVNGQEVQVSGHSSHDIGEGYVQIYGLPNGEVKVEVRDWFYVISDGERMKLTALNGRFRNSVRGLCGVFNDDEANDFLTPENCIVGDYKQFIKSYDIESGEGRGQTQKHSKGSHECVPKEVPLYADVISNRLWSQRSQRSGDCTMHQTRYVEEDGQICFTIGEMPVCRDHCRQRGTITNNVPVHCVKNSNAAQLWRKQINQGQSPDFGHKKETKITRIELPQSCVP